jgi:hypothetical protein
LRARSVDVTAVWDWRSELSDLSNFD